MPSRRALLAALSATLAGCGANGTPTSTRSPTDSPTDTESPTPEQSTPERVELDDDRVRWRVYLPRGRIVDVADAGDRLYVGTASQPTTTPDSDEPAGAGGFAALSLPDGTVSAYRELNAPVTDGPVVHDGDPFVTVGYSGGYDGRDQRLQRLWPDGTVRWASPPRDAWLSIYDFDADSAYLGTGDDGLAPEGETTFAVDLATGEERWTTEGGDAGFGRVDGETLYAGFAGIAVAALNTADGAERWQRSVEPLHSREQSFPQAGGRLFGRDGEGADAFVALDPSDGSTVWERPDTYAMSATPVDGAVVGTDYDGGVFALDAETGEQRWSRQFSGRPETPFVADGRLVVAFSEGPLVALDPATGETDWTVDSWAGRYVYHLSADGGTLLSVASGREEAIVTARRLESGERRWQRRLPGRSQAAERAGSVLALATEESVYGVVLD